MPQSRRTASPVPPLLARRTFLWQAAATLPAAALAVLLAACRQGQIATPSAATDPARPSAVGATPTVRASAPVSATAPPPAVRIGPVRRVLRVPQIFEPHIAVDPADPDHLGAIAIAPAALDCRRCPANLVLARSTDGGATWQEQSLTGEFDGMVAFGLDSTLYAVGMGAGIECYRAAPGERLPAIPLSAPSQAQSFDKPWLVVDPRDGALLIAYTASYGTGMLGIVLKRSTNQGELWSPARVVTPGVLAAEMSASRAVPPFFAQPLPGPGTRVAVAWAAPEAPRQLPYPIWVASAPDMSAAFGPPVRVGDSLGYLSAVAHNGVYHVAHIPGNADGWRLAVTTSRDGGATWQTVTIATTTTPALSLAPGLAVAPNGIIDLVFYGLDDPACFDLSELLRQVERGAGRVDPCSYHAYFTTSSDGGRSFSAPVRLHDAPIVGARFVLTDGYSRPGEYLGMASTDRYAYPIWVDTGGESGTQAVMTRVDR